MPLGRQAVVVCITSDDGFSPLLAYLSSLGCHTVLVSRALGGRRSWTPPFHKLKLSRAACTSLHWEPDLLPLSPLERDILAGSIGQLPQQHAARRGGQVAHTHAPGRVAARWNNPDRQGAEPERQGADPDRQGVDAGAKQMGG